MDFKLTYSTMFSPPPAFHERFEAALAKVRGALGATHAHFIDGADPELRSGGALLLECGASGIRLIPPLMIDTTLADEGLAILEKSIAEAI